MSDPLVSGSRAEALSALRARLAASLATCEDRELASLAKQFRETIAELDAVPLTVAESKSDELARRRKARRANATAAAPAGGGGKQRRNRSGGAG